MCFSATASFIASGSLSVAGGLTLKNTKTRAELPFAGIPLLFGIQQVIEGVVWLSFQSPLLNMVMTYAFSMFSHVLWPIFVPFSILLIEKNPLRKKILMAFLLMGLIVGLYLLYFIIKEPVTAHIVNKSIFYHSPHFYPLLSMGFYLSATCVSCFFSTHRMINLFGIVLLASFLISVWFFKATFFSVWCFFAAILSLLIYLHFKLNNNQHPHHQKTISTVERMEYHHKTGQNHGY